jgi:hypothetical protein
MMLEFTVGINIDGKRESVTVAAEGTAADSCEILHLIMKFSTLL